MPDERLHAVRLTDRDLAAVERSLITRSRMLGLVADTCAGPQVDAEADLMAHVAGVIQQHNSCNCGISVPSPEPRRLVPLEDRHVVEREFP